MCDQKQRTGKRKIEQESIILGLPSSSSLPGYHLTIHYTGKNGLQLRRSLQQLRIEEHNEYMTIDDCNSGYVLRFLVYSFVNFM